MVLDVSLVQLSPRHVTGHYKTPDRVTLQQTAGMSQTAVPTPPRESKQMPPVLVHAVPRRPVHLWRSCIFYRYHLKRLYLRRKKKSHLHDTSKAAMFLPSPHGSYYENTAHLAVFMMLSSMKTPLSASWRLSNYLTNYNPS